MFNNKHHNFCNFELILRGEREREREFFMNVYFFMNELSFIRVKIKMSC
jgi:hypothetical protein